MNNDPTPAAPIFPPAESTQALPEPSGLHKVFFGQDGLRAGWRLAIYLAFVVGLQYLIIQRGLRLIPGVAEIMKQAQSSGVLTPRFELIFESTAILIVFLAAGIMSRIESRSLSVYGLPREGAFGKLF
jgi:CAAX protease family protein